jgi:hypothetical protein
LVTSTRIDSTVIGKKIVSINNIPINEIEQKIIAFAEKMNIEVFCNFFPILFFLLTGKQLELSHLKIKN